MDEVSVIMSTYNAEKNIEKQLDSIFEQQNVNVSVVIRDDKSSDNTINVITKYKKMNPDYDITLIKGTTNYGYAKSFLACLKYAKRADYYAFSDQDDVWKSTKLEKLIFKAKSDNLDIPKLVYSKMQRSDINLRRLNEQIHVLTPKELNKKLVLTQTYNYGAATLINNKLRNLVIRACPIDDSVPHDLWVGILAYWFGKVYYIDEELYYWIRYSSSVTGKGTKSSGINYRVKETLQGKSYPNVAKDLYNNYSDLLTQEDVNFLKLLISYKKNLISKIKLLVDQDFSRSSLKGTVMLKIGILFNWF